MRCHKSLKNDENGLAIVEATILLPVCIFMVIAVYYASIFMCQKANMQANLQNALVYYKNNVSDTYVEASADMAYKNENYTITADGSGYMVPEELFPYRCFGMTFDENDFTSFFRSMSGYMFFDSGDNIEITADVKNYVVYKTIVASAEQTVAPAVSLAMVGLPDSITITVTGEVVVTDGEDFVRNVDFVVDILSGTKIGEMADKVVSKAEELYTAFKDALGIE